MKNSIVLIKEFFSTPRRPVTTEELKELSTEDRKELADAIAAQTGYVPIKDGEKAGYHKVA